MTRRLLIVLVCCALPLASLAFQASPRPTTTLLRHSPSAGISAVNPVKTKSSFSSRLASTAKGEIDDNTAVQVDYDALLKYHAAIAIQMTLFCVTLTALDALVDATGIRFPFPPLRFSFMAYH